MCHFARHLLFRTKLPINSRQCGISEITSRNLLGDKLTNFFDCAGVAANSPLTAAGPYKANTGVLRGGADRVSHPHERQTDGRTLELRSLEGRSLKVCTVERCPLELRSVKLRALELCKIERRTLKMRAVKGRTVKMRASK